MIISFFGTQAGRSNEGLTFVAGPVRAPSNGSARLYDFDTQSHKPTVPQTHMIIWFFSETQMIIKPLIVDHSCRATNSPVTQWPEFCAVEGYDPLTACQIKMVGKRNSGHGRNAEESRQIDLPNLDDYRSRTRMRQSSPLAVTISPDLYSARRGITSRI